MNINLNQKKALILGATSAIGESISMVLAKAGCEIYLVARSNKRLKILCQKLDKHNYTYRYASVNLENEKERLTLFDNLKQSNYLPDILINNISGTPLNTQQKHTDTQRWFHALQGKLMVYMRTTELGSQFMKEKDFGRIINIVGLSGLEPSKNLETQGVVNAALLNFTKNMSTQLAKYGVTVNCINPGYIHSKRFNDYLNNQITQETQNRITYKIICNSIPSGRLGDPKDIANCVCFLASENAGYITGNFINIDGGLTKGAF